MSTLRIETIGARGAALTRAGVGGAATAQVEVDVTPVMNLFMILIPFLVSMAFFSHLAFQSFRLPADEAAGQAQTAAELPWTVAVSAEGVALSRGGIVVGESARTEGGYDFAAVAELLAGARAAQPQVERVVVAISDGVVAADLVGALDCVRDAGFEQIGVAAGSDPTGAIAVTGGRS